MTQTSSKPRVKNDQLGDDGLKVLFEAFKTHPIEEFRNLCRDMIEASSGKRATKDKFHKLIETSRSKNDMLTKVSNYLMAGQGLGV